MKITVSYSGGKESALAVYRAIEQGFEPIALITTFNTSVDRSHFHGLSEDMLQSVSKSLKIPLWLIKTSGEEYAANFEKALLKAKMQGAKACVFGDIDIKDHLEWCSERCENVGIKPIFPLLGKSRKDVVYEMIDTGFVANISIVNTNYLSDDFLGQQLTREIAVRIAAQGADVCGENGEYHTFVSAGPIFKQPIEFSFGDKAFKDGYAMLPVLTISSN
ncbi:MAG: diphthine--ammonia ligase [Defluviitaleaceae bacterium]|nr:diphthine--ammonia ligase [Defluviitaleaceae bacterium]